MNKGLKQALIFISGGCLGAAAGVYATSKYFFAKADKEINEMKEYYETKLNRIKKMQDDANLVMDEKDKPIEKVEEEEIEKSEFEEYEGMIDKLQYNKISQKAKKKKKEEVEVEETVINVNEPKIISYNEYSDDVKYDKVVVSYFEEDGVLMLQDESLFEDGLNILGSMNLEQFGMFPDDPEPDTIYIRNELLGTDYEVVREEGSYEQFLENNG